MENFCRGLVWGGIIGMVIGGVIVAKNKKLAGKIREKMSSAEEKLNEAKDNLIEKLQECDCCDSSNKNCCDDGKTFGNMSENTNFNKKSKN